MTSNIGSSLILQTDDIDEAVKESIQKILYQTFRPEFLNRIDAIVYFKKLSEKDVQKIAKLQVALLEKRLAERNVTLHISDGVIKRIAELGYSPEFGARPLKRAIQTHITVSISQYLLKSPEAKEVHVELKKGEIHIR